MWWVSFGNTARLVCAEFFGWGEMGSNDCLFGYSRVTSEDACRRAAAAFGETYFGSEVEAVFPRGCYKYGEAGIIFNMHSSGAANSRSKMLCSGVSRSCTAVMGPDRVLKGYSVLSQYWVFSGDLGAISCGGEVLRGPDLLSTGYIQSTI